MDSRDSSSSTPAAKDGAACDDDAVLSVTSALAKDAALYFQSRNFAKCIDVLNQLQQKKADDPKVLHNIAITEYIGDGCLDHNKLLEALNNVKKRNEDLARALGEQADADNPRNKVLVPKGTGAAGHGSSIIFIDEFETSVTMLNIGVIWFHLHEFAKALSLLETLFQNIEPIDENIALHLCLLLLDVVLACGDASRFAAVLNYMDKAFGIGCANQGENGSTGQQATTNQVSLLLSSNTLSADPSNSSLATSMNASENLLSRSLSEEALEYDNVLAEIGGQNLTMPVDRLPANDISMATSDRFISAKDLKLTLELYKVRFLLLTRNLKLAKRELKHVMNIARDRDSSTALLLKSQLEYTRGNHSKAITLLEKNTLTKTEKGAIMLNNNLACIYYRLGKCHTASALFTKAFRISTSLRKEKPKNLLSLSQDKSLLITYNCGVLYLVTGKPELAARCFQMSSRVFYGQPLLWLRLAECCLMALQKAPSERSEIRFRVLGNGKWRQLLMEENKHANPVVDAEWPKLSLPLARICLSNALYLLNRSLSNHSIPGLENKTSTEALASGSPNASANSAQEMIQSSLTYYEGICARENHMMKQAILANSAYAELEMEDPLKALTAAKSLLELSDCSRIYVFLGRVYLAEALCLLNRPKEAAEYLLAYLTEQENFQLPFQKEDWEQWLVLRNADCQDLKDHSSQEVARSSKLLNPEEARGSLSANLAALYAAQGDLDKAQKMVSQALLLLPNYPQATITAAYIDLKFGKSEDALARLKKYNRVSFLPNDLQLGKSS